MAGFPHCDFCSLFCLLRLSARCASSKQSSPRITYQADIINPTSPTNRYYHKKGATCGEGTKWRFAFDKGKLVGEMYNECKDVVLDKVGDFLDKGMMMHICMRFILQNARTRRVAACDCKSNHYAEAKYAQTHPSTLKKRGTSKYYCIPT